MTDIQTPTPQRGSLEAGIAGNYHFVIGETLREAWAKTAGAKATFNLAFLAYFGVVLGASFVAGIAASLLGGEHEPDSAAAVISAIIQQIMMMVITLPLGVGLFMLGLKRSADQPIKVSTIFDYFSSVVPLLLTTLLMYVMLLLGFLLLILPGIYLSFAYYFALPLVINQKLGPWQALEASRKAVSKRWFSVFGLALLLTLINILAIIPLGIGLIWTIPMSMIAMGTVYRNMFGYGGA